MNTIIIICNDPRIAQVRDLLQPLLVTRIVIVADFDTGLKEVFEKRPLVVFIQDEIGGVRGETVTRHIKALLQANSPCFIQLEHPSPGAGMSAVPGRGINLNLPEEELVEQFREELAHCPDIAWKKENGSVAEAGVSFLDPEGEADEAFTFFSPDEEEPGPPEPVPPPPAQKQSPPLTPPSGVTESRPEPAVPPAFPPAAAAVVSPPPQAPPVERVPVAPPAPPHPAPAVASPGEPLPEEPPFPVEPVTPGRSRRLLLLGGVAVLIVCGGLIFLFLPKLFAPAGPVPGEVTAPRKHPIPAAVPPVPAGAKLPSFIPREGLDPAYGAARPGWERYAGADREFLLFREGGKLRALQVIALRADAIAPAQVSSILRELCGDAATTVSSRSERDGYLVEQRAVAGGGEVLIYTKKGTGETRGVVITLP